MAQYNGQNEFWNSQEPPPQLPHQSFNFEVPVQFGQELNFQQFDHGASSNSGHSQFNQYPEGSIYTPPSNSYNYNDGGESNDFENEPPLMEELGINLNHILQKTLSVLNPFRTTDQSILQDTDLAGPLVFCLALGSFLLLSGKVTFSYIYGIGVMGCLASYALLSLMVTKSSVTLGGVISVLGYCILPMVVLSGINVLISIQGTLGYVITGLCILWCAISASKLFVTAYAMDHQQILIAYPCVLFYGVFALIIMF